MSLPAAQGRIYLRQWRSGRDFAREDDLAIQMANYAYALGDRETGEAYLVDPAHAPIELAAMIEADGFSLAGAVLTHFHADHAGGVIQGWPIAGVAELCAAYPIDVHLNGADLPYLLERSTVAPSRLVAHADRDALELGGLSIELLSTPGHTPGSQCCHLDDLLLTGDTLFLLGCGRTDGAGGDAAALYESLQNRLAEVPDATVVLPGHDYADAPYALLGELRRRNPVLVTMPVETWLQRFGG